MLGGSHMPGPAEGEAGLGSARNEKPEGGHQPVLSAPLPCRVLGGELTSCSWKFMCLLLSVVRVLQIPADK